MSYLAPCLFPVFCLAFLAGPSCLLAQHVRLERCEPAVIQSGKSIEVRLHGGGLEEVGLWTSFPAKIERIRDEEPLFRITTDYIGPGALRAHSDNGVSNLVYLRVKDGKESLVASQGRTKASEAQELEVPTKVEGSSQNLGAHFFRFGAEKGKSLTLRAEARGSDFDGVLTLRTESGRRLAQADDSQIDGLNPRIDFTVPEAGFYIVELIDSEYRGGKDYQLWVEEPEQTADTGGARDKGPVGPGVQEGLEAGEAVLSRHVIGADTGVVRLPFSLSERSYITLIAAARKIRSSAVPRIQVLKESGEMVAESSPEVFDEQEMQIWLDAGSYKVEIRDAYGRRGPDLEVELSMHSGSPPFSLSVPGQKDKKHPLSDNFLAVPGGVFVIPVQCSRKGFNPVVRLQVESSLAFVGEQDGVPGGQGSTGLRVRLPEDVAAGTLHDFWIRGVSEFEGSSYETRLETRQVLKERDASADIPESINGLLALRVMKPLLKVEVTSPAEVEKGAIVKMPVTLNWEDGGRRFNSKVRIVGLPEGVKSGEKSLDDKTSSVELELKIDNPEQTTMGGLVVEVEIDFHRHPLRIESAPFFLKVRDKS
ncbi:MAG TPA: hypothetical protein DIV39_09360 [Verrucomicrobiales bacterium]|nr:hypothetical protein [Verrucomicrobiales bacterium]